MLSIASICAGDARDRNIYIYIYIAVGGGATRAAAQGIT
jgi:hypothetical protein